MIFVKKEKFAGNTFFECQISKNEFIAIKKCLEALSLDPAMLSFYDQDIGDWLENKHDDDNDDNPLTSFIESVQKHINIFDVIDYVPAPEDDAFYA